MNIIFDLDDTVYRSNPLRINRERAILKVVGDKIKEYRELKKINTTTKSLEKLGIPKEELYKILESVPIALKKNTKLTRLFKKLKDNHKLIIISNSPKSCVLQVLEKLELIKLVDEIYGGDSFKEPKPSDEAFSLVKPGDICIGNNFRKDLEIPKKKGAITILISKQENKEADFSIKSILELESILLRLGKI